MPYFWIFLAITGLLIYSWPYFVERRMYEGFETKPSLTNKDLDSALAQMKQMFSAVHDTPDLDSQFNTQMPESITPPTKQPAKPASVGAKAQPESHTKIKSTPASVYQPPPPSEALQQGSSFTQTKPAQVKSLTEQGKSPIPVNEPKVIVQERIVQVPRPCPPRQCPPPSCPPKKCPNVTCPDLRDYIRKDSIPCWACKLK